MPTSLLMNRPFLHKLQQLAIHNKRAVVGARQGAHASHKRGSGLEFYEYKSYTSGDDFRSIDWGVVSRTGKTYVRRYREEQENNIAIILDNSYSVRKDTRLPLVALCLMYTALYAGDTAVLSVPGASLSPRSRNPRLFPTLISQIESLDPQREFNLLKSVQELLKGKSITQRVFILSDFFLETSEIRAALSLLKRKNAEFTLLMFETGVEELIPNSGMLVDQETGEHLEVEDVLGKRKQLKEIFSQHVSDVESEARYHGGDLHLIASETTLDEIMFYELRRVGVLR